MHEDGVIALVEHNVENIPHRLGGDGLLLGALDVKDMLGNPVLGHKLGQHALRFCLALDRGRTMRSHLLLGEFEDILPACAFRSGPPIAQ